MNETYIDEDGRQWTPIVDCSCGATCGCYWTTIEGK